MFSSINKIVGRFFLFFWNYFLLHLNNQWFDRSADESGEILFFRL